MLTLHSTPLPGVGDIKLIGLMGIAYLADILSAPYLRQRLIFKGLQKKFKARPIREGRQFVAKLSEKRLYLLSWCLTMSAILFLSPVFRTGNATKHACHEIGGMGNLYKTQIPGQNAAIPEARHHMQLPFQQMVDLPGSILTC